MCCQLIGFKQDGAFMALCVLDPCSFYFSFFKIKLLKSKRLD